jgi:hypothetical protein
MRTGDVGDSNGAGPLLMQEQTYTLVMKSLENAEQVGERRPSRSTDHEATMSNSFAFTTFIMASSPGRLSLPLAPLMPAVLIDLHDRGPLPKEMPVVQERPLRAARAHDQADGDARDYALSLGASRRGAVSLLGLLRAQFSAWPLPARAWPSCYRTPAWALAAAARAKEGGASRIGFAGNCSTVALCPDARLVTRTIAPFENSSAS